MNTTGVHRPRNLDWKRAAALLYGDWGTSKAYVIGLAFLAAGYSSLPIILAVCVLTAVVGYNYTVICRHFPDGGGVYSAAREQSRVLAVIGALLLVANFTVTAAMSGWAAMSYFGVPPGWVRWCALAVIFGVAVLNYFGPKHTGSVAATLAVPMVACVILIVLFAAPDLTTGYLKPPRSGLSGNWVAFVGVILALSGVEAIANLTGVMKLDSDASYEQPRVAETARRAIWPVALEVVVGTSVLGWAMLSIPPHYSSKLAERAEDMVRFLAEHFATNRFGPDFGHYFGLAVGIVVALLLLSAVNTALGALIGLFYMMTRDGEMPRPFSKLNAHGVPRIPLVLAAVLPLAVTVIARDLEALAGLYAIGVVGAITVNLGSCVFNRALSIRWYERLIMGLTFVVLFAVELTIARTRNDALFFACCVVGAGLGLRGYAQKRAGLKTLTVSEHIAAHLAPEESPQWRVNLNPGQSILVAARGLTPVLRYALEEARLRQANLYVLYIKEIAVTFPGPVELNERPKWQHDRAASRIMYSMLDHGKNNGVAVVPIYTHSDSAAATIVDLAATLGIDILILGASQRRTLAQLLKGDVVHQVARELPENIQLVIYG